MRDMIKRLLRLLLPFKMWVALAISLSFLSIGSSIGLMMTSAYLIGTAALHPSVAQLQVAIVGVRFFGLSRGIFRYIERLIAHQVAFRLLAQLRVWFFNALEPLAPACLSRRRSGDLLARVVTDVEMLQNFYIRVLAPPVVALLVSLLMGFVYGFFSWSFACVLFMFMLAVAVGVPLLTLFTTRGIGARVSTLESELAVLAVEGVQGLADLMVFGRDRSHFNHFAEKHDELIRLRRRQKSLLALHQVLIGLLMNITLVLMFIMMAPKVNSGVLQGVSFVVLALGIMASFEALTPLPNAALFLEEIESAAKRLFEIITPHPPRLRPPLSTPVDHTIEFSHVTFRYSADDAPVLKDFSLTIPHGQKMVIVGASGLGKTTLTHLLLRFWEIQQGRIVIGGHDINQWSPRQLADMISLAPQDIFLFSGSIRDNLLLAHPRAKEEDLERVCQSAQLLTFIRALPNGLDTQIGEGGYRLSGGERRRLNIARALLKDSPILIFDEPTAHLDVENESAIWRMVTELSVEKTVVIITHRAPKTDMGFLTFVDLQSCQDADRV
ncbi:MAG: thiol reductant ABC exporter subunit CydC [Calditrichaeota bacterium]|nr:MAG: thiol reductant ABC exporter subunit CydC [Calditrichota bacterium]